MEETGEQDAARMRLVIENNKKLGGKEMTRFKKRMVLLAAVLGTAMMLGACGGKEEPAQQKEETAPAAEETAKEETKEEPAETAEEETAETEQEGSYLIGISTDSGFEARGWEVQELYRKAEESGGKVEIIEQVADDDSSKQIQQIKSMVDQGVNAIVVCSVDMNAIGTALDYAAEKGVIVTLYDRQVDHEAVAFCATYASYNDGIICANEMIALDETPEEEKVVFELIGNRGDINAIDRHEGFRSVADGQENWTIVEIETNWDTGEALNGLQNALQKYPDVWGIFCASSHMDGSIETALKEVNRWKKVGEEGHVNLVSLGGEAPGPQLAVDGYTDKLCVIMFDQMGSKIYDTLMTLLQGGKVSEDEKVFGVPTVVYTQDKLIEEADTLYCLKNVKVE